MPNWGMLSASFDGANYMHNVMTQKFNFVSQNNMDMGAEQVFSQALTSSPSNPGF